jgi:uncharacterized membrane protein YfcA
MLHDIILFSVGILVGAMNAIAGGGMLIGFPAMLAMGIPPIVANATTGLIVLPGNLAALMGYRKYLRRVPRQYLWLVLPVVLGAAIGTYLLRHTSSRSFADIVPELILFAVILFAFQPFLYRYLHRHIHGPARLRKYIRPLFFIGLAILPVAIYGGYFGAGFGFIMLSFLGFTGLHEHIHRMNALKSVMTTSVAVTVLVTLWTSGLIDWHHGIFMGAGTLLGGYVGTAGTQKVSTHAIRMVIVVIGLISAAYLGLRSY